MALTLETRSYPGNKLKYSELGANLKWLVDALVAEDAEADHYLNHGENRDPTNAWGPPVTGVNLWNYYQPASAAEQRNGETIRDAADYSGRRRLIMRKENDKVSFFTCSHPQPSANGLRNNGYGAASWINMQA